MSIVTLELPDELVAKAEKKGLLSFTAIEAYLHQALDKADSDISYPQDFDPRLKGAVSPALYGKIKTVGDIIGPFHDEWENGY